MTRASASCGVKLAKAPPYHPAQPPLASGHLNSQCQKPLDQWANAQTKAAAYGLIRSGS